MIINKKTVRIFTAILIFTISSDVFADQRPIWNKNISEATYHIYKVLTVCGGEYGTLCKIFLEPDGNIDTPKIIHIDEYVEKKENKEIASMVDLSNASHDLQDDMPKNRIAAQHYIKFLASRPKVEEYKRRMKLY